MHLNGENGKMVQKWVKLTGNREMDRKFMFMGKILAPGG